MVALRVSQALARLVSSQKVSVQTKRTLYPHYTRYMAVFHPNAKPVPGYEKAITYLGFLFGILGPPMYIMYDIGQKRPKNPTIADL